MTVLIGLVRMSRFYRLNSAIFLVLAGALVAAPGAATAELLGPVACVFLAGASMNVLNDLLDKEGDELTNPSKPLVSGSVRLWQAMLATTVLAIGAVLVIGFAVDTTYALVGTLGLYGIVILCGYLYARLKKYGWLGPIISAIPGGLIVIVGFVMMGGRGLPALAVFVAGYGVIRGLANNLLASLQDVDADPKAGTMTVAVRLGAPTTFALAVGLNVVLIAGVVALAVHNEEVAAATALALLALAILGATSVSAIRTSGEEGRGRARRQRDQGWYNQSRMITETGLVAAFSPVAGIIAGVGLQALWAGGTAFEAWSSSRDPANTAETAAADLTASAALVEPGEPL